MRTGLVYRTGQLDNATPADLATAVLLTLLGVDRATVTTAASTRTRTTAWA
ncbi:hypothetical protein [Nocardia bhagyanarayanae]|uniref:hypothetical protein n=1 Tax=Nocardia bhagyanarayanae TaxID=1215925 RepID=UPI00163A3999|nr:hypothetical protein [Nocardia bhagyanarayanae]